LIAKKLSVINALPQWILQFQTQHHGTLFMIRKIVDMAECQTDEPQGAPFHELHTSPLPLRRCKVPPREGLGGI
jgi:hypothetical protein